ncbi:hypothetical protein HanXRQr2_Chr01g0023841 [Helianthus annuus]|uniref:Uncharacterized protein n=1 Tax=Helianthus annuus TaxID=4232 RepID=A0A9K3JW60_HELAN|nr:hypothetical protein HanXRQr2_Chr01g0023841 [Helianthus annuus]
MDQRAQPLSPPNGPGGDFVPIAKSARFESSYLHFTHINGLANHW